MSSFNWVSVVKLLWQVLVILTDKTPKGAFFLKASPYERGRSSKQEPPHSPGGYRWRNKQTGNIDYIGISNDLKKRHNQHRNSGRFSSETHDFEWKNAKTGTSYNDIRQKEKDFIKKHNPTQNRNAGGGGRNPHSK